jgi:catalase
MKNRTEVLCKNTEPTVLPQRKCNLYQNRQFCEKHDFEKAELLTQLMRGNLRYKMIDFDLTKFISYDKYQGIRLGAGNLTKNSIKHFPLMAISDMALKIITGNTV